MTTKYIIQSNGVMYATFEYKEPLCFFSSSRDINKATQYTREQAEKIKENWSHKQINIIEI